MAKLNRVWISDAPDGGRRGRGDLVSISMRTDLQEWNRIKEFNDGGRASLWLNAVELPSLDNPQEQEMAVVFGYLDIDSLYDLYGAIRKFLKEYENEFGANRV